MGIIEQRLTWPHGRRFAFTIVDDTDSSTLANVKPIYDLLAQLGMRTTKTAWIFRGQNAGSEAGATCEQPEYLDWLQNLKSKGFEIAFHNAAPGTSSRDRTEAALKRFRELFGTDNLLACNHGNCAENMYWGQYRLSGWRRGVYQILSQRRRTTAFRGHLPGDPLFWGDLCQQHVRYFRNFVFDELDTLEVCAEQPYHDPDRPFVNFWFTSADGATVQRFLKNFSEPAIQRLVASGGLCIAYVHFAYGFMRDGSIQSEFQRRLEFIARHNGWFAPASEILDYLRQGASPNQRIISPGRLGQLERKWLMQKLFKGTT